MLSKPFSSRRRLRSMRKGPKGKKAAMKMIATRLKGHLEMGHAWTRARQ